MFSSPSDYVKMLYCGNKSQYYMISLKKKLFFFKGFLCLFYVGDNHESMHTCNAVSAPAEGEVL